VLLENCVASCYVYISDLQRDVVGEVPGAGVDTLVDQACSSNSSSK